MSIHENFGHRIRIKRVEKNVSLRKFAALVGISPTYASKIERGEFPPPIEEKIKIMANILNENPDELLALVHRVPSDLSAIIRKHPAEIGMFLRAARKISREEWKQMTKKI